MNWRTNHARNHAHAHGARAPRQWRFDAYAEPPLAAHLVTPRPFYTHHGIYVGGGRVVHYAGLARSLRRGPVEEVSLEHFAGGAGVWIRSHAAARFDHQTVVQRARSRLGENRYRVLSNNCEHFSEWCLQGVSRSRQVERWLAVPRGLRALLSRLWRWPRGPQAGGALVGHAS